MQANALVALSYVYVAIPYVVALALGLLVPVLGVLCYSSFGAGIAVIVGMFAVEALYMIVGGITLGVSIFYTDFALVFAFTLALLRLLTARNRPRLHRAWFVYCAVAALSLASGLATYGSTAGVQARPYFYFSASALYGMSFSVDEKKLRFLLNVLASLALLLLCITAYRWIVYYTPIKDLLPPEGAYNNDGPIRVIRSYEALVLAQVLVTSLFFAPASHGLMAMRVLSPLVLAVTVVLQHRSVWGAALAGIFASVFAGRLQRGSAIGQAVLLASIVVATALPLFLSDDLSGVNAQITSSAGTAVAEQGSAGERLSSWREIVNKWVSAGPRSIVIGQSFGTDPERSVRDASGVERKLEYTAHNMYVQTLFNTGLIGLGAFLFAAAYVVRGLYRICAAGRGGPAAQALLVLVVMQLVYYVPYGTDYLQSLIFGIALSYVASQQPSGSTVAVSKLAKRRTVVWRWT